MLPASAAEAENWTTPQFSAPMRATAKKRQRANTNDTGQ